MNENSRWTLTRVFFSEVERLWSVSDVVNGLQPVRMTSRVNTNELPQVTEARLAATN